MSKSRARFGRSGVLDWSTRDFPLVPPPPLPLLSLVMAPARRDDPPSRNSPKEKGCVSLTRASPHPFANGWVFYDNTRRWKMHGPCVPRREPGTSDYLASLKVRASLGSLNQLSLP